MFQKLANAVADQVIYKLAALNQAYSQNDTLAALRMEKRAHLQAAMKLAQLEKVADEFTQLDDLAFLDNMIENNQSAPIKNPINSPSNKFTTKAEQLRKQRQAAQKMPTDYAGAYRRKATQLAGENKNLLDIIGNMRTDYDTLKTQADNLADAHKALGLDLNKSQKLNKILGGTAAGLGGLSAIGGIGLGIANARKAKQIAKLKQLGLLGGGAAALGGLGLGYLMGDN